MNIKVVKDGPYLVSGDIPLDEKFITQENQSSKYKESKKYETINAYALCRCGKSRRFPFCDGTHQRGFKGEETAEKDPFQNVTMYEGDNLRLEDAEHLCSLARFCHSRTDNVWDATENNNEDVAIEMACNCPSGRLVMYDKKSGVPIEPAYEPGITLLKDLYSKHPGPLFVKGGIQILSSSGEQYKIRNRVTLCCCGKSKNKPFCDSSHLN